MSTHVAAGTSTAKYMLCIRMASIIVLLDGALVSIDVMDQMRVSMMKGLGLNLISLPWETLYQLQDGITAKLCIRESCTI